MVAVFPFIVVGLVAVLMLEQHALVSAGDVVGMGVVPFSTVAIVGTGSLSTVATELMLAPVV